LLKAYWFAKKSISTKTRELLAGTNKAGRPASDCTFLCVDRPLIVLHAPKLVFLYFNFNENIHTENIQ